jgi:hypothetical protein
MNIFKRMFGTAPPVAPMPPVAPLQAPSAFPVLDLDLLRHEANKKAKTAKETLRQYTSLKRKLSEAQRDETFLSTQLAEIDERIDRVYALPSDLSSQPPRKRRRTGPRCGAIKSDGTPCKAYASGGGACAFHIPRKKDVDYAPSDDDDDGDLCLDLESRLNALKAVPAVPTQPLSRPVACAEILPK